MSSKSILIILSYTVSKFARFSETQCSIVYLVLVHSGHDLSDLYATDDLL